MSSPWDAQKYLGPHVGGDTVRLPSGLGSIWPNAIQWKYHGVIQKFLVATQKKQIVKLIVMMLHLDAKYYHFNIQH